MTKVKIIVVMITCVVVNGIYAIKNRENSMSMIKWEPFSEDLAIDVYEQNGNVIAKMNVPGIDEADLHVRIEDGKLHVLGKREQKKEINEKDYYQKEIKRGSFDRVISLPTDIDPDGMEWEVTDGVLTVTIPQRE